MFQSKVFIVITVVMLIIVSGCSSNELSTDKVELTISAAASLKESLEKIQQSYEKENPNVKLRYNFGGSGSLQQQIAQGAPVDLFFSSAEDKFNKLVDEGFITEDNGITLLQNELVLIVPTENTYDITKFEDLIHKEISHISIGIPETVPAGKYAKETLESLKIWTEIESKIVFAKDVRQVLSYVETGNVEAGIVYKSDALQSEKVTIISTVEPNLHSPIVYPIGIINGTKNYKAAKDFYNYIQKQNSLEVFEDYGFTTK
jgi:molybdate transport system substrate-binding protein